MSQALRDIEERGYANTTTPEICRRAHVSQGALFNHFPSKSLLLSTAVRELFRELHEEFGTAFEAVPGEGDRVGSLVRLLWKVFTHPRVQVSFELFTHSQQSSAVPPKSSRSDSGLRPNFFL